MEEGEVKPNQSNPGHHSSGRRIELGLGEKKKPILRLWNTVLSFQK